MEASWIKMATATTSTVFRRTTTVASLSPFFIPLPSFKSTPSLLSLIFRRRRLRSVSITPSPPPSPSRLSQTLRHLCSSYSGVVDGGFNDSEEVMLKGMRYGEFENWVTSQGYRPAQALMVWKLLYGNNSKSIWAHSCEELEGLNKDLMMMLRKRAKLKALQVKDIITASDGTRKGPADFV